MAIIAQLSDPHIAAGPEAAVPRDSEPLQALQAALTSLLALPRRPDRVVVTGDLADGGRPQEYAALRSALDTLPMPYHVLPGNHDDRVELRAAFPEIPGADGPVNYTVQANDVRLVCCDSTVPGRSHGRFSDPGWLDATLAEEPDVPAIVAMHHPPFPIGVPWVDAIGQENPETLAAVVRGHQQVARVITGHVHRGSTAAFAGTMGTTCPSTYRQLRLDLSQDGPPALTPEPGGYALHVIEGGAAVTHFCPV